MKLRLTRDLDDLPPQTTDDELLEWAATLRAETPPAPVSSPTSLRPKILLRPKVVLQDTSDRLSDEELFADIFERAAAVSGTRSG